MGCSVGIDVAKDWLDVAFYPPQPLERWGTTPDALAGLCQRLQALVPDRVVLEATGGLEAEVVLALEEAGVPVVVTNPRLVRAHARSIGRLAKTDRLDAQVIAHYAAKLEPEIRPLPDATTRRLRALVLRRDQLTSMLTAERNRLARPKTTVVASVQRLLTAIEEERAVIEQELQAVLEASPLYQRQVRRLQSVPGIGPIIAVTLTACLPELGQVRRQPLAALAGVAPLNQDSGQRRGHATTWGGRRMVRKALYLAVLVGIRWNPCIQATYRQLLSRGKAKKVALVACMRKLLTILNAMVRQQTDWWYQIPEAA
jgi:transposase